MQTAPLYQIRDALARDALRRMEKDRERARSEEVARFISYLASHLFDEQLALKKAYAVCEVRERSFLRLFQSIFGMRPKEYIQSLRIEVGTQLLVKSLDSSISAIAGAIGFNSGQAFSKAFVKAYGEKPSLYRARLQTYSDQEKIFDHSLGQKVKEGQLGVAQARILLSQLKNDYPEIFQDPPQVISSGNRVELLNIQHNIERLNAELIWQRIQGHDHDEPLCANVVETLFTSVINEGAERFQRWNLTVQSPTSALTRSSRIFDEWTQIWSD